MSDPYSMPRTKGQTSRNGLTSCHITEPVLKNHINGIQGLHGAPLVHYDSSLNRLIMGVFSPSGSKLSKIKNSDYQYELTTEPDNPLQIHFGIIPRTLKHREEITFEVVHVDGTRKKTTVIYDETSGFTPDNTKNGHYKQNSGPVSGLVFGLASGLVFGLASGPVSTLVFGLAFDPVPSIVTGLVFGLVSGLVFGLVSKKQT